MSGAPKRVLIVDGYNVINARSHPGSAQALADARDRLVNDLEDYAGFSGQEIVVVFDAWQAERPVRSVEQRGAVRVVFTGRARSRTVISKGCATSTPRTSSTAAPKCAWRRRTRWSRRSCSAAARRACRPRAHLRDGAGQAARRRARGRAAGEALDGGRPDPGAHCAQDARDDAREGMTPSRARNTGGVSWIRTTLRTLTDEEIVRLAQRDKDGAALEYLLNKYKNFVRARRAAIF